jgi:predicted nucleic acid-binding protein
VLDACVLFPTVLREILIGVARRGLYAPLWSDRILEEWARATVKLGPGAETLARGEIAVLKAAFPAALVPVAPRLERRLWLPDPDDVHVLASAIAGSADLIVTFNAADFPRATLTEEGLTRQDPDQFLAGLWLEHPETVTAAVTEVAETARRLSGEDLALRPLLKRAKLPRLGKHLG